MAGGWFGRRSKAGADDAPGWDARREQALLTETLLRTAARGLDAEQPQALILAFCQALVDATPHLRLCWTWFGPPDTDVIVPQIVAGPARAYAEALVIRRSLLTSLGPAFRTLAGHRLEPFTVGASSLYGPWREAAREHGVRSTLAVPLASTADAQRGIFVLYADRPGYFDAVGVGLFEALGALIGAALSQAVRNLQLSEAARTDALTGALSRSHGEALLRSMHRGSERDRPVGLMMLDLDDFKRINDRHGHAGGDAVLQSVVQTLLPRLRRADAIARWGGDEFVLWLPATELDGAVMLAEKLRAGLEAVHHALPGGETAVVTVSIGVTALRVGEAPSEALQRADFALYAAKRGGRNRVVQD